MKLLVWLDIACPFCYIGKSNLDKAIHELEGKVDVEVEYKSFRLNPTAPVNPDFTMVEELAEKYGKSEHDTDQMVAQVVRSGKEAGLEFTMDKVVPSNTMDAHRLVKYAARHNRADEVLSRLYKAYFEEGQNVAEQDVLLDISESAELDEVEVRNMLAGDELKELIFADQNEAKSIGAEGVPFIVINQEYALPGARQPEDYVKALQEVSK